MHYPWWFCRSEFNFFKGNLKQSFTFTNMYISKSTSVKKTSIGIPLFGVRLYSISLTLRLNNFYWNQKLNDGPKNEI